MKQFRITIMLTVLMSMFGTKVFAHSIEVANKDGVIIYYNWIKEKTELEVSHKDSHYSYYEEYSGKVDIPESVEYEGKSYSVTSICSSAFRDCSGLTSVTIPNSMTFIGSEAFMNCSGLISVTIPDKVTSIENGSFSGCSGLTSVTIGKGVTSIGGDAFRDCNVLSAVHISDLAAWCNIDFYYRSYSEFASNPLVKAGHLFLNDKEITNLVIPDGVTEIKDNAFYGCSAITSVSIPSTVTSIGNQSFYGCDLTGVQVSDVGAWCNVTFKNKDSNPLSIAQHLFINGEEVVDLVIPEGTTTIGNYAFRYCKSIKSVKIPNSVKNIKYGAFAECEAISAVHVSDIGSWCNITFGDEQNGRGYGENPLNVAHHLFMNGEEVRNLVIPSNVNAISDELFRDCSGLTSVKIEEGATTIGKSVFYGCNKIKTVEIPNSITTIGNSAFRDCVGMTTVNLGDGVTTIGSSAFSGCSGLIVIIIPKGVNTINSNTFENCTSLMKVTLSEGIETIGANAFHNCSSLTTIDIPNTLTSIGQSCFYNCESLSNIAIPEGVSQLVRFTFAGCKNLKSVIIPKSMVSMTDGVFANCFGLEKVVISDLEAWCNIQFNDDNYFWTNPLRYAGHIFLNGEEIKNLVIPETVTSLNVGAFYGGGGFTSISIPKGITTIPEYAFYGCSGATSVNLPDDLTMIKGNAFQKCSSLETIMIPSKVEYIYQEAFAGCSNLISVKSLASTPPLLYENAFSNYEIPLSVPEGARDTYLAVSPWNKFKEILSGADTKYTLTYKVDGEVYKTYDLLEGAIITPEPAPTKEGYDFSGWSTIPATMPAGDLTITGTFSLITDEDEITIKSYGKGTYCSRYDLDFSDTENLKAFIVSGYDHKTNTIWLTRVKSVPAGTGIIVKGTPGDYKVKHVESLSVYANFLVGTTEDKKIKDVEGEMTNFVLSKGEWYRFDGEITLPKGMAYLPLPLSKFAGTRSLIEVYEDNDEGTTEIRTIEQGTVSSEHDVWFTLQGQRVTNPGKGIYIRNGRKIVVK